MAVQSGDGRRERCSLGVQSVRRRCYAHYAGVPGIMAGQYVDDTGAVDAGPIAQGGFEEYERMCKLCA